MSKYANYQDAIIDLHERGYCEDFVLFGDDLLWIREKTFLNDDDFSILECHSFGHPNGKMNDLIVFGVVAVCHNIKGILMNHYTYSSNSPAIIVSKLNKIRNYSLQNYSPDYIAWID